MNIEQKLEQARARSEEYGRLYGAKETADDFLKVTYAQLYAYTPEDCKTVGERDAWVKSHKNYVAAVERKENAYADWKTAETYMKLLMAEADVWRTQQANERWIDRAHA